MVLPIADTKELESADSLHSRHIDEIEIVFAASGSRRSSPSPSCPGAELKGLTSALNAGLSLAETIFLCTHEMGLLVYMPETSVYK